ncbi:MAG: AMP-binding protein, partial [Actinobacteria bacterium]|nr:AMP-binding protein [Actinomycetota bacterium]
MPTILEQLERVPAEATALRLPGEDVAYGALRERIATAAASLAAGGVGAGDRVLLRAADDLSRLIGSLAVQRLGAAVVPINPLTSGPELDHVVARSAPAALIAGEDLAGDVPGGDDMGVWIAQAGRLTARRPCARSSEPVA